MNIKVMFDEKSVLRTLARLSHEIIEKNDDANELYIVGIRSRGVSIAKLLAENIKKLSEHFEGRMLGGCIDILSLICGTKYDKVKEFNEKYKEDGIVWYFDI